MEKKSNENNTKIAGRFYEVEDYNREDSISSGLATTHEQVSDDYMEGTVDGMMQENVHTSERMPKKE
ncbi:hypothetical protein CHH83_00790 [Bacillus sp. 7586-K]|uniref:DUF4025 domain-containing protein n=1 Tax=Metabacillus niabensis TaxID=324854 RepID=A0ABT9Z2C7_9BACI|nr:YozQ family protein [Metabacillus niabensis]MDQ0225440.1 hypothetical protein [Metabacillus niabensis]PAD71009.1 hypothetical protein CHH83_00790 [Bacillus sp. 7586-K]